MLNFIKLLFKIIAMYQIKQVPEDFIVEEIPDIKLSQAGDYLYFTLEKKNWTTLDAVAELARRLCQRKPV